MKKLILATLLVVFAFIIISSNVENVFAQMNPYIPPRQQMQQLSDPSQVVCREGFVPMMRGSTGTPACVNPNTWLRLADRGWGDFDMNMMQNKQMQRVMNSMLNNPHTGQLWYDVMTTENHIQEMSDQMSTYMQQNPRMMMPIMNWMMNDPELRQQMIDTMASHQQTMQMIRGNNTMMNMMMGQGMMGQGMIGQGMMNDPQQRQQIIDSMLANQQMVQDIKNNPMMMNAMRSGMMMPMMNQTMMGGSMMGMAQGMRGPMMGQGMMGQGMMTMMNDPESRQQMLDLMMQNPHMMRDLMNNQQMRGMMGLGPMMNDWNLQNPQMMQNMMNQMMQNPELMQQMHEIMINNPWHMQGMMSQMMGPMMNSMMNDPELRQQMLDLMLQHQEFMQNLAKNSQFQQNLNP